MWSLNRTLFSKPAVFGAVGVDGCGPCPPGPEPGWTKKSKNCLYVGRMTDAVIWKVFIDKNGGGEQQPRYKYADAKAKCSAWGATLVRDQDVLDAVRFRCKYLVTLPHHIY